MRIRNTFNGFLTSRARPNLNMHQKRVMWRVLTKMYQPLTLFILMEKLKELQLILGWMDGWMQLVDLFLISYEVISELAILLQ